MNDRAKTERDLVPMPGAPRERPTVWLTRDSDALGLWEMVDVWLAKPTRYVDDSGAGGFFWHHIDEGDVKIARHRVDVALRLFGTIPDDDRQCIRVGE